jgi:hypothetical protein
MSLHLSRRRDPADLQPFEGGLPDMIEVVRFASRSGRGPALVVSHRKLSGPVLARLRRVADETEGV